MLFQNQYLPPHLLTIAFGVLAIIGGALVCLFPSLEHQALPNTLEDLQQKTDYKISSTFLNRYPSFRDFKSNRSKSGSGNFEVYTLSRNHNLQQPQSVGSLRVRSVQADCSAQNPTANDFNLFSTNTVVSLNHYHQQQANNTTQQHSIHSVPSQQGSNETDHSSLLSSQSNTNRTTGANATLARLMQSQTSTMVQVLPSMSSTFMPANTSMVGQSNDPSYISFRNDNADFQINETDLYPMELNSEFSVEQFHNANQQ